MKRSQDWMHRKCTALIGCCAFLILQNLCLQAENAEWGTRSIEVSVKSSARSFDRSNLDRLNAMLGGEFEDKQEALKVVFRNPDRFRGSEIEEKVLKLCYEAENVDVRYYAIRSYARLKGPEDSDMLALVQEAFESDEPKLQLIGAYALFETDDPRKGVEMMVPLVLGVESKEIQQEIWTVVSSYLRREEAFRYRIRWPGVTDTSDLLNLLSLELDDSKRFWEDNEIRKNLRKIYLAARYYFAEHLDAVTVKELHALGYLEEIPEAIKGEKYSDILIPSAAQASGVSVKTKHGRQISYLK